MTNKNRRGGLGRGLGALIPTAPPNDEATEGGRAMGYPSMPPYDAGVDHQSGYVAAAVPVVSAEPDEDTRRGTESDDAANGAVPDPPDAPSAANPATSPVARSGDAATTTANGLLPVAGAHFVNVPVESIRPNPKQPRQVFDEQALEELTHSIREFGVLQPIVVRAVEMHATDGGADGEGIGDLTGARYELVMGERRLRAAIGAGLTDVPAIVRTTADDAMLRDALLENIHRAQLNPLEEAAAYQQLLEEFGATHDELAVRIGRSRPQVSNTIRLLNLPVPVQRRVAAGILSAGHARALLSVDDSEVQEDLAGRIVAEGLSVRATEELVALHGQGHGSRKRPRKVPGPRITAPALAELADRLSDAFDTRVKVDLGRSKGKITVEFATIDDLERIVGVMSGQLSAHPTHPMHDVGAAFARVEEPAAPDHAGDDMTERPDDAGTGEPAAVRPSDAVASPPAGPAAPTASDTGEGYSGWGSDHVPDLGAWDERIRYDPNES